ncbi:MAG: hypothetical protein Q7W44_05935 [Coriobacteriia bacterium]|nr:hypothetical protein [Coriobacteriia bacterium]
MRTHEQLLRAASAAGFPPEPFEEVERLLELLAGFGSACGDEVGFDVVHELALGGLVREHAAASASC